MAWREFTDLGTVTLKELGEFDAIDAKLTSDGDTVFLNIGKSYLNFDGEFAPCFGRLMITVDEQLLLNLKLLMELIDDATREPNEELQSGKSTST